MVTLRIGESTHALPTSDMVASVRSVDCGRYSPDNASPKCEHRAQAGIGILVVAAALLLAVGFLTWRVLLRRYGRAASRADGPKGP